MSFSKMFSGSNSVTEKCATSSSGSFFSELTASISNFSRTLSNVTKVSSQISSHIEDLKPSVTDAASSFTSTCNSVTKLLDKIMTLIEPFIKAYSFVASMYKSICDMVAKIVASIKDKFTLGFNWVLDKSEDVDVLVIAFLIFAISMLIIVFICPSSVLDGVVQMTHIVFNTVGNFFSALYKLDWLPTWSQKFSMMAQANVLPGESMSHSPLSQVVASLIAFGISTLVFVAVPGRPNGLSNPLSKILYSAGSGAQQCNQLFTLFRNMKDCTSQAFSWVLEIIVDIFGFKNPVLSAISATLSTDLFTWMEEVDAVCDPAHRLENFANPAFTIKLQHLREQALKISAYIATHPVAAFMSHRVTAAIAHLDKIYGENCQHTGVGQYRAEPFMVQWYGASGCGKSTSMRLFINDVLDRMEEPKLNRLYAVSKRDAYWSNYAHQTAILMDDMGALRDGAGQCQDIKDLIDIKSTQPAPLPMAAVEDKGRHFTSRYIFATSNLISAPAQCGLTYPDAFERRRDVLVECRKVGEFNTDAPTSHLEFDVVESKRPHAIIHRGLSYDDLLEYVVAKCKVHAEISGKLYGATSGKVAQVDVSPEEIIASMDMLNIQDTKQDAKLPVVVVSEEDRVAYSQELTVEALKYAYQGSLNPAAYFPHDMHKQAIFDVLSESAKETFTRWVNDMLYQGCCNENYRWLIKNIPADYVMHFKSFIYASTINERSFDVQKQLPDGMAHRAIDADVDTLICVEQMPAHVQFLYTAFVRYWCRRKMEQPRQSWVVVCYHSIVDYIKNAWYDLPYILRVLIKAGLILIALNGAFGAVTAFCACWQSNTFPSAEGRGGITNESNSISSRKNKGKSIFARSLLAQAKGDMLEKWASDDGFINEGLKKNLVVLRLGEGVYFRGTYVCSGWVMTVAHAFSSLRDGTTFSIIHAQSISKVQYNAKTARFLKEQDIVLLNVGNPDGPKPDIRKHFPVRDGVCFSKGTQGVCVRAVASKDASQGNLEYLRFNVMMSKGYLEKVTYQMDSSSFKLESQASYEYHMNGENGDCGTLLLLPNVQDKQPCIVGIHCASYDEEAAHKGFVASNATAIFRDQLEDLPTGPVKVAMVRCQLLKDLRARDAALFEEKQVAFVGTLPAEQAATVPHKTTLRKSGLFEAFGPAETAPSIISASDKRGEGFDPYVAGIQKYNETAQNFDEDIARLAYEGLRQAILPVLHSQRVPFGKPVTQNEDVVLNGVDGFDYFDGMELSTSCGYPYNKLGMGTSKREFVEPSGDGDRVQLKRTTPIFDDWEALDVEIRKGNFVELVTTQCAKDERLPLEKVFGKRKTRLFEILPFHYNMLVRKYFLDFSASLMASHNALPCKVGINPGGIEWTLLANGFRAVSDTGFSADYSSFDGRAPIFAFQWFCDLVDDYYGSPPGSPDSNARHVLLMMASCHYTICENKVFRLVGGMPSGFALTVIFNSLLNEFYMRYAFISLLRRPHIAAQAIGCKPSDFNKLFVAVYGDDNLVAVPMELHWYTLPAIAQELEMVNVIIKNGIDKNMDVSSSKMLDLSELTFLSRGFKRHRLGYVQAPLKWVSIIEPMYWIRPSVGCPDALAMLENIDTGVREAFHHGPQVFEKLVTDVQNALKERCFPATTFPTYFELEQDWLVEVTGNPAIGLIKELHIAASAFVPLPPGNTVLNFSDGVHTFADRVSFCSSRTAAAQQWDTTTVLVNCTGAKRPTWVRGPTTWRDFEGLIWPYTMAAIKDHICSIVTKGVTKPHVVFVCGNGYAIGPVCAALYCLSTGQYSSQDVVVRLRTIADVTDLSQYPGGCAKYLLKCADTREEELADTCKIAQAKGETPAYIPQGGFSLGNFRIVQGRIDLQLAQRLPFTVGPYGGWGQHTTRELKLLLKDMEKIYQILVQRESFITLYFDYLSSEQVMLLVDFLRLQGFFPRQNDVDYLLKAFKLSKQRHNKESCHTVYFRKPFLSRKMTMESKEILSAIAAESLFGMDVSANVLKSRLLHLQKPIKCSSMELAFKIYCVIQGHLSKEVVTHFQRMYQQDLTEGIIEKVILWLTATLSESFPVDLVDVPLGLDNIEIQDKGFSLNPNNINMNACDAILFQLTECYNRSTKKHVFCRYTTASSLVVAYVLAHRHQTIDELPSFYATHPDVLLLTPILTGYKAP
uniref:RNA1 polyprotein n=1 Tax=Tomato torrado virus TaxID=370833 RepID=A0A481YB71_9SECO|nr:polyprotein [Tomato torrado virus]